MWLKGSTIRWRIGQREDPLKVPLKKRLDDLMLETDPKRIKHILKALFKFSGYSSDFDFETKEEARNIFLTPQHQLPYAADHEIQSLKNIFG